MRKLTLMKKKLNHLSSFWKPFSKKNLNKAFQLIKGCLLKMMFQLTKILIYLFEMTIIIIMIIIIIVKEKLTKISNKLDVKIVCQEVNLSIKA